VSAPEIILEHPIKFGGVTHGKLTLSNFSALANFRTNSPEQVILSLSRVYRVPRRVIRNLHPDDANRAGDLLKSVLDDVARSF
jgi:hypothetical protein